MNIDILPHTIYATKLTGLRFAQVQKEVKHAIENSDFDYMHEWGKTVKLSNTKNWATCVMDHFNIDTLKQEIDFHVTQYAGRPLEYKITSWLTRYDKGDYAQIHNHTPATYSGCYYYNVEDTNSCNIFFDNGYNRAMFSFTNGDLVLFPSYLNHGVTTNESDKTRFTLAFNLAVY